MGSATKELRGGGAESTECMEHCWGCQCPIGGAPCVASTEIGGRSPCLREAEGPAPAVLTPSAGQGLAVVAQSTFRACPERRHFEMQRSRLAAQRVDRQVEESLIRAVEEAG